MFKCDKAYKQKCREKKGKKDVDSVSGGGEWW